MWRKRKNESGLWLFCILFAFSVEAQSGKVSNRNPLPRTFFQYHYAAKIHPGLNQRPIPRQRLSLLENIFQVWKDASSHPACIDRLLQQAGYPAWDHSLFTNDANGGWTIITPLVDPPRQKVTAYIHAVSDPRTVEIWVRLVRRQDPMSLVSPEENWFLVLDQDLFGI